MPSVALSDLIGAPAIDNTGSRSGKVREVTPSGLLVQSVSRNAVVIHDLARLEGRFEVGQEVEIRYNEGRGSDSLQGKPHDQGVSR